MKCMDVCSEVSDCLMYGMVNRYQDFSGKVEVCISHEQQKDSNVVNPLLGEVTEIINELRNNNMKGKLNDRNDLAYHAGYYNALKDLKEKISGISA